jgi:osmotically-inducible protein OsmY
MKRKLFIISSICLLLSSCDNTHPNADNTGRNVRDRDATLTPGNQSESESDRKITQKIRQAVVGDDALSTNAKNIKIITIDGIVTLRGPVNNDSEKQSIDMKAKSVQGVKRVDNLIEIIRIEDKNDQ